MQGAANEEICRLIDDYAEDPYCLRLIEFFSCHPDARFSGLSVLHALGVNSERYYIERAMAQLIDKGIVKTYSDDSVPYYGLTDDCSLRQSVVNVISLDWGQWQKALQRHQVHIWGSLTRPPTVNESTVTNA